VMEAALTAAVSGRKGPVWIDVPLDMQSAILDSPGTVTLPAPIVPLCADEDYEYLIDALSTSTRPVVLIGSGVQSAGAELLFCHWAERLSIPVTFTASAPDTYGTARALSIGSVGSMGCSRAGNFAIQNADLVLVLGSRLNTLTTGPELCKFARNARVVVVDIDPVEHSKESVRIDRFIHADVKTLLERLSEATLPRVGREWIDRCLHWKRIFAPIEPTFTSSESVDLYALTDALSRVMPRHSTLVTDSGLIEIILPTNMRFDSEMRCIHPTSQGSMGFALPAAIGVLSAVNHPVVAVIGDGSIMMNLQELETVRHRRLPLKLLVVNNNVYSIIRRRQRDLFRRRTIGTDPSNGVSCPEFVKVAECFGFHYVRIDTPEALDTQLREVLQHDGPVLCEIMGRPDQDYIEVAMGRDSNGRSVRRPLEDQSPFLDRDVFRAEMVVAAIDQ